MAVIALVGLAAWAMVTTAVGAENVVQVVRLVHAYQSAVSGGPDWFVGWSDPMVRLDAGFTLAFCWVLSLAGLLPAVVLGVVDIALDRRSVARCLLFAAAAVVGPLAALLVSQASWISSDPPRYADAWPGAALVVIAAVTLGLAWSALGLRSPVRSADQP